MIVLDLSYSLGNQMFEYAYARALSIKYGEEILMNESTEPLINWGDDIIKNHKIGKLKCKKSSLRNFQLNDKVRFMHPVGGFIKGGVDVFRLLLLRKSNRRENLHGAESYKKMTKKGMYYCDDIFSYYEDSFCLKKNKKLLGVFGSGEYFKDIEDIIRKEFKIITPASAENEKMLKEIKDCNAVCVHIRRGDFFTEQYKQFQICTEKYYKNAMNYIAENTENPQFFIFSNTTKDLKWIKETYKFEYPVKYVELNNPDYEELRLMENCKHFIISNSTFSWWASFLAESKNKIVVAPNNWMNNYDASMDSYRKDMIQIEV